MLCSKCLSLDFRYAIDWQSWPEEIYPAHTRSDRFDGVYPSDEERAQCEDGLKRIWVHAFHYESRKGLIESACNGCHLYALIAFGLAHKETPTAVDLELHLPEISKSKPTTLTILSSPSQAWYDPPVREWFYVCCGSRRCKLIVTDPLHSESSSRLCGSENNIIKLYYRHFETS